MIGFFGIFNWNILYNVYYVLDFGSDPTLQ